MQTGGGAFLILLVALAITILIARAYFKKAEREAALVAAANKTISDQRTELDHKSYLVEGLTKIIEQRKIQFPWLAKAFADFSALDFEQEAKHLERKKHPAVKAAETVREYGRKQRETVRELRTMRYRVDYYERLFPWILDYVGNDVPDSAIDVSGADHSDEEDQARYWLSKADYDRLPTAEKYQRALDNWRRRPKTNWQIGRDYERYIGYVYETQGYDVEFTGAIEGFEDMGRDLIARRESELAVIQCKYWAAEKEIREKHIFQLFASALEYGYRLGGLVRDGQYSFVNAGADVPKIKPVLYTSTKVSDVAKEVAGILGVTTHELAKISDYPMIKCNISKRDGQRIYHLPFDQQYDRIKIKDAGESYVYTVADAESLEFRRAWRWRPETQ